MGQYSYALLIAFLISTVGIAIEGRAYPLVVNVALNWELVGLNYGTDS